MPGGKSPFLADEILDFVLRDEAMSLPADLYVALFTGSMASPGDGTEVSGGSYAREAVTRDTTNWAAPSGGAITNAVAIDFGTATADWGTLVGAKIMDASSGGNVLYWVPFSVARTVLSGQPFAIPVAAAVFTEA